MIQLSILVPTIPSRRNTHLLASMDMLYSQLEALPKTKQDQVEILYLMDNKTMPLGTKRNLMYEIAQGKYVTIVDDDDRVADDYIETLLEATKQDTDVINFVVEVSIDGGATKPCYYSIKNDNRNAPEAYYRTPNHISCIRRSIIRLIENPDESYGEDFILSKSITPFLKTEYNIDKVLYYYDYFEEVSEKIKKKITDIKYPLVDVVVLSKATNKDKRLMTQNTIDTCLNTTKLPINIIVIEQAKDVSYTNATTYHKPEEFNFNRFANYGAMQGKAKWIMIANNDLEFTDNWLEKLLEPNHPVVSPYMPGDDRQEPVQDFDTGYGGISHFSGWCFMLKRKVWQELGGFNDGVNFWYSDSIVIFQLEILGIPPMLVKQAIVKHRVSQTLNDETKATQDDLTKERTKDELLVMINNRVV